MKNQKIEEVLAAKLAKFGWDISEIYSEFGPNIKIIECDEDCVLIMDSMGYYFRVNEEGIIV